MDEWQLHHSTWQIIEERNCKCSFPLTDQCILKLQSNTASCGPDEKDSALPASLLVTSASSIASLILLAAGISHCSETYKMQHADTISFLAQQSLC